MHSRSCRFLRAGPLVVLACAALAGCAGSPSRGPADERSVVSAERSSRGNPPFYEVAGKRYFVLDTSDGYRERGVASWYGRDFHGRPTSSGEIYDMNRMTAAHKTLPLPTWVEVTNLVNGRRIIVKVNDRGPFIDGRIIDLSRQAATELGMLEAGTARVQVRALGASGVEPSQLAAAEPDAAEDRRGFSIISEARADAVSASDRAFRPIYVQVGAFADPDNANRLSERVRRGGFDNSFVLTSGSGRSRLHRVRIGPVEAEDYDRVQADLRALGVYDATLVQDN
ncbi:MAG TPA: septal ring lytic transglycosylase RlpA family protein [Gammaproteobacteria bacterium]|jgi:rare lipoprotein A